MVPQSHEKPDDLTEQAAFSQRYVMEKAYGGWSAAREAWKRRKAYVSEMNELNLTAADYLLQHPELTEEFEKLELI